MRISDADDLSQRLPQHGTGNDEMGRLVTAFNDTLGRLEQLFLSQQRFLADVSHELRTPLTVIKGNVDLMRRMKQMDAESLDNIEDEADRLTRLVGDLLLEAQAESGKLPLHFAPVEMDTLLLEVFKEMRVLARERVQIKTARDRPGHDQRRPRPVEAGADQPDRQCHQIHAARRRGLSQPGKSRQ